jgi:hypothetical protein
MTPLASARVKRGTFPKGSSSGLWAICALTALVPFLVLQSLIPALKNGLDLWIGSFLPVVGAGALAAVVVAAGIYRLQRWLVGFVFTYGCFVLACFVIGFCLALILAFGVIPDTSQDLHFVHYVNIIEWIVFSPPAWLLLRTLRLRYWQPWTGPDEWEPSEQFSQPRTLIGIWLARRKSL